MVKLISAESFGDVLDELSKEVKAILDAPNSKEEMVAFVIYMNTLKGLANDVFGYLPKGERNILTDMCAAWLDIGLLLGKAPQLLAEILKRTGAKITEIEN
jgi:hypothetical protein